jgi:hypothetical protein
MPVMGPMFPGSPYAASQLTVGAMLTKGAEFRLQAGSKQGRVFVSDWARI